MAAIARVPQDRAWGASTDRGPGTGGRGEGGLEHRAQGKVHFQAAAGLDAQDSHEAGLGQREGREHEGGPGLEPDRGTGRAFFLDIPLTR